MGGLPEACFCYLRIVLQGVCVAERPQPESADGTQLCAHPGQSPEHADQRAAASHGQPGHAHPGHWVPGPGPGQLDPSLPVSQLGQCFVTWGQRRVRQRQQAREGR